MTALFYQLGKLCSRAPVRVALAALLCSLVLCLGLTRMHVQTDPQALWVPPASIAAREQARFDALFHPFFRVQQLIFYVDPNTNANATNDLVQREYLLKMADIETRIARTSMTSDIIPNATIALADFCYRPIHGKGCLVTSPLQYWRGNASLLATDPDIKLTTACQTTDPYLRDRAPCMDAIGVPVMRNVVFGGLANDTCHANPDPCGESTPRAAALVVTFLLNSNPQNATYTALVAEWEQRVFLELAQQASTDLKQLATVFDGMQLTYMAQRSIADSLDVQTTQNAFIVAVSYAVMFLYVSLSLGDARDPVQSRFGLGMTGIAIVVLSLGAAMGVSAALFQLDVTMITLEVVPFLVLAIGVDNMFILTNEFDRLSSLRGLSSTAIGPLARRDDDEMLACVLGETLANVGPSIVVAAVAESLAFAVGMCTRIPALESFCAVAAVAVVIDFVLQVTWFAAALVLDTKRVRARRYDLCPFIRQTVVLSPDKATQQQLTRRRSKDEAVAPSMTPAATRSHRRSRRRSAGVIQTFVVQTYTPLLMKRSTKVVVLLTAGALAALSVLGFPHVPLGLEQSMAVPTDFYLHEYFDKQTELGEAGPIAYIVLDSGIAYTDAVAQSELNRLLDELASVRAYLQLPIYSWLHTFNQWRQMRFFLDDKIASGDCDCPEQPMDPFTYELQPALHSSTNVTPDALFYPLVHTFTGIAIDSQCCQQFGLCGAQFEGDIVFTTDTTTQTSSPPVNITGIEGSRLRFQVNALTNQTMFVNSYYYLHAVTERWSARTGMRAFPYALYFVYYEQYTYIQGVALESVLLALAVVFVAVFVLMGRSIRLSALVTLCVLLLTLSELALVFVWNCISTHATSINAVSVVNLLACVGLGVEFCVHMAHQFAFSQTHALGVTAADHTRHALTRVGASVVSGITLTKLCGIGVLAFAPSMLFRVYFFRMYMGIVVLGCFYGLALLPVLLSLFGQQETAVQDDLGSFLLSEERDDELDDEVGAY